MRQYDRVYPPGVTSADIVVEDDITLTGIYVHNFTLYYVIPDDIIPNQNVAIFTFGKGFVSLWFDLVTLRFLSTDKGVFQSQFGPFYYEYNGVQ